MTTLSETEEQIEMICPIDIDELLGTTEEIHDMLVESFKGVRVIVDPNLTGNNWYCVVSKELFDDIAGHKTGIVKDDVDEQMKTNSVLSD